MRSCCPNTIKSISVARLLLAGLILVCSECPALAVSPGRGPKREPQRLSNAQLREALYVLQATKRLLQSADHDYGGHRVAAIRETNAAEQQLRLALRSQHRGRTPAGKTGRLGAGAGRGREPQAISTLQLADAIVLLEQTRFLLHNADHDYGGHRAAAVRDLGGAVEQLKIALRFEKRRKG